MSTTYKRLRKIAQYYMYVKEQKKDKANVAQKMVNAAIEYFKALFDHSCKFSLS